MGWDYIRLTECLITAIHGCSIKAWNHYVRWRGHAHLLYANWLNYYVYQVTPFDVNDIPKK